MVNVQYDKASLDDREEIIDFANYVFSHSSGSLDFLKFLPKLYKPEYFMEAAHYIVRENGRIKAAVGAYPLKYEVAGTSVPLPGRGIGMVSVNPYARSKGYMKALMNEALSDMKKDSIAFSCLGGQRQRYEYFGFYPTGSAYVFSIDEPNITHTLGRDWNSPLTIKQAEPGDTLVLDQIFALHEAKGMRMYRSREKLFDTLSSWTAKFYSVFDGGTFLGYFVSKDHHFTEIQLTDISRLTEVAGHYIKEKKEFGHWGSIQISAGPHETDKLAVLSRLAGYYAQSDCYQYAIFDYARFADTFIKYKNTLGKIKEGSFVLGINAGAGSGGNTGEKNIKLRLFADSGEAGAEETDKEPSYTVNAADAHAFLFSPLEAKTNKVILANDFLFNTLPLPLYIDDADKI